MKLPRAMKLLTMGAGSLLLLALLAIAVGYLLAPHFYLTRTIFWGESDYRDHEKFPARTVHNAPPISRFDQLPQDNPYASDRKSTRLNSSHANISYAVFCLKKKKLYIINPQ